MRKFALPLMLLSAAALPACGFSPMYGSHAASNQATGSTAEAALDAITIGNIPDQSGVYLRNALIDRFYKNGYPATPRYKLEVEKVRIVKTELDLTKSSEATRNQLTLATIIRLYDAQNPGAPLLTRNLSSVSSHNILESEFATRVTEDNARLSGLDDIARQIELNIVLFLNRGAAAQ